VSWAGKMANEIAIELDCHLKTVRIHLIRFNTEGISGLGMREGAGRKPRLTEWERSRILALVKQPPPGWLERRTSETLATRDEEGPAQWTLDGVSVATGKNPTLKSEHRRLIALWGQPIQSCFLYAKRFIKGTRGVLAHCSNGLCLLNQQARKADTANGPNGPSVAEGEQVQQLDQSGESMCKASLLRFGHGGRLVEGKGPDFEWVWKS
jgi:transposase